MKILHVIPYFGFSLGGEYTVCKEISLAQTKAGHEVTILTSNYTIYDPLPGVKIVTIPVLFSVGPILYTPKLKKWLIHNINTYDIIHLHSFRSYQNIVVCKTKKKINKPIIIQAHGSIPIEVGNSFLKKLHDRFFLRVIITNLNGGVAISEKEINDYLKIGISGNKIVKIPNGLSEDEYRYLPNPGIFRERFRIDKEIKLVLFVGRLDRIKGPDLLIKACKIILDQNFPIHLVIIGPDLGMGSELRELIEHLGIEKSVSVIGPLYGKEKISAYVDSDLVVIPSRYETFPMVLLEALMSNCRVILTNKCSIANDFADIVSIVEPDPKVLSKAIIIELINDLNEGGRPQKGRERILLEYSINKVIKDLDIFYKSTMIDNEN